MRSFTSLRMTEDMLRMAKDIFIITEDPSLNIESDQRISVQNFRAEQLQAAHGTVLVGDPLRRTLGLTREILHFAQDDIRHPIIPHCPPL